MISFRKIAHYYLVDSANNFYLPDNVLDWEDLNDFSKSDIDGFEAQWKLINKYMKEFGDTPFVIDGEKDKWKSAHKHFDKILKSISGKKIKADIGEKLRSVNLKYVTGYDNYTPETIAKLKEMFDKRLIESFPRKKEDHIVWLLRDNWTDFRHRPDNLPAYEDAAGEVSYWFKNKRHREDGEWASSMPEEQRYALNDKFYTEEQFYAMTPEQRKALRPK